MSHATWYLNCRRIVSGVFYVPYSVVYSLRGESLMEASNALDWWLCLPNYKDILFGFVYTCWQVEILKEIFYWYSTGDNHFYSFVVDFRAQGWRSGESTRLPPMWPGFDSQTRRHMWVEFVGSLLCTEIWFDLIWDKERKGKGKDRNFI